MKQKNIIFVTILIVLVAILLITIYPKEKSDDKTSPCNYVKIEEALNKSDVSLCESADLGASNNPYYDNFCRESCISAIAYKEEDTSLCALINPFKNITHIEGRDDPRETGSVRDHCYLQLVSKLNDTSLCENVETDWAKDYCSSLI